MYRTAKFARRVHVAAAIPAYDAVHSVGSVVTRTRAVIKDVLVIDDGSNDGTAAAAQAAGSEVHTFPENRGKGAALRAAFEILFSRGFTAVVTIDADGQHLPEETPRLIAGRRQRRSGSGHARSSLQRDGKSASSEQPSVVPGHLLGRRSGDFGCADGLPTLYA